MPRCQLTISPYVTKLIPEPRGCVRVLGVAGAGRQRHQRLAVAVTRQAAQERILRDLVALQVAAVAAAAISCCSGADGKPVSAPDDQQQACVDQTVAPELLGLITNASLRVPAQPQRSLLAVLKSKTKPV